MLDVGKMTDAVLDAIDKPMRSLHERLRMVETVPPELAEQVKTAIHLLHESPPIVQQNAPARPAYPLPPPRPSRIERDENGGYTLIYDGPQP